MARRRSKLPTFSLFSFQDIITSVTGIMILVTLFLALEVVQRVDGSSTASTSTEQAMERTRDAIEQIERELESLRSRIEAANEAAADVPLIDVEEARRQTEELRRDSERIQRELDAFQRRDEEILQERDDRVDETSRRMEENRREIERMRALAQTLDREVEENDATLDDIRSGDRIYFAEGVAGKMTWILELSANGYAVAPMGRAETPKAFRSINEVSRWASGLDPDADAFLIVLKPSGLPLHRPAEELLAGGGLGFDVGIYLVGEDKTVLDPVRGAGGP